MCTRFIPCPLCCEPNFTNIDVLRTTLINVSTRQLTCPMCNETCSGLDKFTIHLFSHSYMNVNNSNSTITSKSDPSCYEAVLLPHLELEDALKNHPRFENRQKFALKPSSLEPVVAQIITTSTQISNNIKIETSAVKCDMCGFHFENENVLSMHRQIVHSNVKNESNNFPCHLCSRDFKMRGSLRLHLRVKHYGSKVNGAVENTTRNIGPYYPVLNPSAHCTRTLPAFHVNLESNEISDLKETNASPAEPKQWECDVCAKSFTTKYFLKKHKRLHTGEMPYRCTQCNKTFTFQQSYHKHLLYHSSDKPHTCTHCGRSFKELSTLHNHQRIHTGEKPFSCETCGKCFRQRVSYLVHRRIHTGVMPYKCTACDKNFRYKVSQRTHKCPAQPPGTVIRQSGDLLQKLLQNTSSNDPTSSETIPAIQGAANQKVISATHKPEDSDTIDNIVEESYNKMYTTMPDNCFTMFVSPDLPGSPTDKFQNLCIASPQNDNSYQDDVSFQPTPFGRKTNAEQSNTCQPVGSVEHLQTINQDSLKKLLSSHISND